MSIKSIQLKSPTRRILLAMVVVLCALSVFWSVKWCLANTFARRAVNQEIADFSVGLALDDPQTHYAAAVLHEKSFGAKNSALALQEYEAAAALSPNDYRLWIALGKARELNGDMPGAEQSLRKALELAPNYSLPQWTVGNFLLRQQKIDEGFSLITKSVESDPTFIDPAISVAWQAFDGDVEQISHALGDTSLAKGALSALLAKQGRFDEALKFWNGLSGREQRETFSDYNKVLLQFLINAKKYRAALRVQAQVSEPNAEKFEPDKIFNAGFESDIKTANASIFEWQIADGLHPQVGFDDQQKHGGARSLAVIFNSPNGKDFRSVQQIVAVESGKHYIFNAFSRSDLKTAATVKWEIADAGGDNKILASTADVPNNSDWQLLRAEFTTAPATEAVIIRLARAACKDSICPVTGKVWFDDFSLEKK